MTTPIPTAQFLAATTTPEVPVSDNEKKPRKTAVVSPLVLATRELTKAGKRLEVAERRAAKVQDVQDELTEAREAYNAAKAALDAIV